MRSVLSRLKNLFAKEHPATDPQMQIIHEYMKQHRALIAKHEFEKDELLKEKTGKIRRNDGIESLSISQEYNLKLLRLLAEQKREREKFNNHYNDSNSYFSNNDIVTIEK